MEQYLHITNEDFISKINSHLLWLAGNTNGERLYLNGYDLSYRNFDNMTLQGAVLINCYLRGSTFNNANCLGINLSHSVIAGCSFIETNLYAADLSYLDFGATIVKRCDLRTADLSYCNFFQPIDISENEEDGVLVISPNYGVPLTCPEKGSFIGFKKAQGYIVELLIPASAKRSSAAGRECRASSAEVISITEIGGAVPNITSVHSDYDEDFIYTIGETVSVDNFDENRWNNCSAGIHFYITRKEAVFQ